MNLKNFLIMVERKAVAVKEIQEMYQVLGEVETDYCHLLVLVCPLIYSIDS